MRFLLPMMSRVGGTKDFGGILKTRGNQEREGVVCGDGS